MQSRHFAKFILQSIRQFSFCARNEYKVTVIGAAGGVGQPLSLLLKQNPLITDLALHDIIDTPGIAKDLSHIDTNCNVEGYIGEFELPRALQYANIIVFLASVPENRNICNDAKLSAKCDIIIQVCKQISKYCPEALVAFITNPLNVLVPFTAEVLKHYGIYNPNRLFGVTTLIAVRSRAFLGDLLKVNPQSVNIPVIGGRSMETIIPCTSVCTPKYVANEKIIAAFTKRIQEADTEIEKAKGDSGAVTFSMAYAGANFIMSMLKALNGEKVTECAYVESNVTEADFFSNAIIIGKYGVEKNLGLPKMSDFEEQLKCKAIDKLRTDIKMGRGTAMRKFVSARANM